MKDKEKIDVGDRELWEEAVKEFEAKEIQTSVEIYKKFYKGRNVELTWEECIEKAKDSLRIVKEYQPEVYEAGVNRLYFPKLEAQKKKENEQEAVQAAEDEEIVTAIYPFFKVKDNSEDTKRELARRLVGRIRQVWKMDIPEKKNCKGGSKCKRTLDLLIEQDRNKVINLQNHGSDLRDVLGQYRLYTAKRQNWDKQISKAERG